MTHIQKTFSIFLERLSSKGIYVIEDYAPCGAKLLPNICTEDDWIELAIQQKENKNVFKDNVLGHYKPPKSFYSTKCKFGLGVRFPDKTCVEGSAVKEDLILVLHPDSLAYDVVMEKAGIIGRIKKKLENHN